MGALAVLALFVAIIWAGYRIARYAPDLAGTGVPLVATSEVP